MKQEKEWIEEDWERINKLEQGEICAEMYNREQEEMWQYMEQLPAEINVVNIPKLKEDE
jgi:hypothetical protein